MKEREYDDAFVSEKIKDEEVQKQRLEYWQEIGNIPAKDLIAADETGVWEGMERKYARSSKGKRVYSYRQKYKGQKCHIYAGYSWL